MINNYSNFLQVNGTKNTERKWSQSLVTFGVRGVLKFDSIVRNGGWGPNFVAPMSFLNDVSKCDLSSYSYGPQLKATKVYFI